MTAKARFSNPDVDSAPLSNAQLEQLIELQASLLGATVSSDNVGELLDRLCRFAERLTDNAVASIMLLDEHGETLHVLAAPSIPLPAIEDIDGLRKGDGSCGNAVFHNEDMYVCDTLSDVRWENVRDFAKTYKIHACWSSPIRDEQGRPIGSFALSSFNPRRPDNFQRRLLNSCASIASLILQRKTAFEEQQKKAGQLLAEQNRLAVTIDSLGEAVISIDTEGRVELFNRAAEQLTGQTREQAVGQPVNAVLQLLDAGGQPLSCSLLDCLHEKGGCNRNETTRLLSASGEIRDIEMSTSAVCDIQDNVIGAVVTIRDVSQLVRDKQALEESRQRYQSILENSADAICLINRHGDFIDSNRVAYERLGYSRDEYLCMNVADIETEAREDISFEEFFDQLDVDRSLCVEGRLRRKDGSTFPVEIRLRKFISNDEAYLVASTTDISQRRQMEEEMLRAGKLESIGLLAGGIAHDFNNLLGIILGHIDLAGRDLEAGSAAQTSLEKARKASMRASDLTRQLLTFSKGGEPVRKVCDIRQIVSEAVEFSLHGTAVEARLQCQCEHTPLAFVDAGQISQVVQNLVINARQAMGDVGIIEIIGRNVTLHEADPRRELEAGAYIEVTLCDNGPGVPDAIRSEIFDPYFTTKQDGNGLGLALTYSIVKKHGGHISVANRPEGGACFTVWLPAAEKEETTDMTEPQSGKQEARQARVLVMDDDEMIREIAQAMLENLGCEVEQAEEGEQALVMYRQAMEQGQPYDLLIMDLTVLSGMGGREAMEKIRQLDPTARALVSSGYSNDPVMANYADYGFSGAVSKPYTQDELAQAVQEVLG